MAGEAPGLLILKDGGNKAAGPKIVTRLPGAVKRHEVIGQTLPGPEMARKGPREHIWEQLRNVDAAAEKGHPPSLCRPAQK